jgi:hypothetical protein
MTDENSDPPSDPGHDVDALARALLAMRTEARVWRVIGAACVTLVTTVGMALAGVGWSFAQQGTADHERVARLERDIADVHGDISAISHDLTRIREDVAAIRGALGVSRSSGGE